MNTNRVKKLILTSSLAAAAVATAPATLAETSGKTAAKQGIVFSTATIAGAALGGPLGMVVGALGGAYMGEHIEKADTAKQTELALAESKMQVAELQVQLARADAQVGELSSLALDKLEFQVLFHTGADQLTERGRARVVALAKFLQQHPDLSVRLTGHADPRGTDEYNNVLSEHRAISVQNALATLGVDERRIDRLGLGSNRSTAPKGDYEAYAMERRVDIEIYKPAFDVTLIQAH